MPPAGGGGQSTMAAAAGATACFVFPNGTAVQTSAPTGIVVEWEEPAAAAAAVVVAIDETAILPTLSLHHR